MDARRADAPSSLEVDGDGNKVCQEIAREVKLLDALMPMVQMPLLAGMHLNKLSPEMLRVQARSHRTHHESN